MELYKLIYGVALYGNVLESANNIYSNLTFGNKNDTYKSFSRK